MTNEEEIVKEFDEKFGKAGPERNSDSEGRIAGCDDCSSSVELRQEHRDFLIAKLKAQDKIARDRQARNIGMLRQWLNEDRITDPKKMVENEDIKHWLDLAV